MKLPGENLHIRAARCDEAQTLSGLALRSKAHWGYPADFIEACRAELSYTQSQVRSDRMRFFVIERSRAVIGFYALMRHGPTDVELEALFVEPTCIGLGYGRLLIEHAKSVARDLGATQFIIRGDANATPFYVTAGGVLTGTKESASIPGRLLPTFALNLVP